MVGKKQRIRAGREQVAVAPCKQGAFACWPACNKQSCPPKPSADGYCNSRVAQFDAKGKWVRDFTVPEGQGQPLLVPHRWE